MSQELYDKSQAYIIGRRRVCYEEGHRLKIEFDDGLKGGAQGASGPRSRQAACDLISCKRCDVVFTATYPPITPETGQDVS